jgi:hypothetical protein
MNFEDFLRLQIGEWQDEPYCRSKNEPIRNIAPHYTNEYYKEARTVYLANGKRLNSEGYVKGAEYNYSDRLWQWDWDKANQAWEVARAKELPRDSAALHEAYLTAYYGKELELVHIMAGFNWSSGYPYQVYGVIFKAEVEGEQPK